MFWLLFVLFIVKTTGSTDQYDCIVPTKVEDRRPDKSKWTVAQYNVEWLFTEQYKDCPGSGCSWNSSEEEYVHLAAVANVIKQIDADTVHMCEVQSCTQLKELIKLLPGSGYKPYLIEGTDTYTGQNVGLITKIDPIAPLARTDERVDYPIENNNCDYTGENGSTSVSKHLFADFSINNNTIHLVGAHLLSNPNDPTACVKREAQTQVLQNEIVSKYKNTDNIIVIGDLNDFDPIVLDMNSNLPNSRALNILYGNNGTYSGQYELFSVGNFVDQTERYTNWYDPNGDCTVETSEYSAIDHILTSKSIYSKIENVYYYHDYEEGCDITNSDHYPIIIEITI